MPIKCKERERIVASGHVGVPALPVSAVRGFTCFRCFSPPPGKLYRCLGCKRAGYCSKECQKLDWAYLHKKLCKPLREANQCELDFYQDKRSWEQYSNDQMKIVRQVSAAAGHADAYNIVQGQPYCINCHRSGIQLAQLDIALDACADCRLVSSCNKCQATHPQSVCDAYKAFYNLEQFRISLFEDVGDTSVITCTEPPRTTHKLLKTCSGWYDYYVNISDKGEIRDSITPDFSRLTAATCNLSPEQHEFEERRRMFLIQASDNLTMPLTIVAALEDLSLTTKTSLSIHLLGATGREFLAINTYEEILHLLPALNSLSITAIGPAAWLNNAATSGFQPMGALPCCDTCRAQSRQRSLSSYKGLYHDFASTTSYSLPDLVVAFNSGHVDGDDADTAWRDTIKMIIESGCPALFTTYNAREARSEQALLHLLGARFVVAPEENVWRGMAPQPEFLDREFEMWVQNSWRYIIQGRE
ncbi:hypothetical protein EJ05DRAFT_480038 [Pseudovirgaria hyperparasitica]|uniref:MYND-type domain-containing protein n=1 Tax=Pseudovirgaria hyperparasitica TaxID=470096 RepID=A0A6A6VWM1_9PEZI|nr:uncharacterized protein EJ05DRAFT_480038 [Pseudovirgaria hyperparasitica]KAF2754040.1 hypothetical protein EJ05DRAFT_480038 [Pseudovirgaria hyperparasitica]